MNVAKSQKYAYAIPFVVAIIGITYLAVQVFLEKKLITPNTDCSGVWSECTDACETAGQREWMETIPQTGTGLPCPEALDCTLGEGECSQDSNVDCIGVWSECTDACETAEQREWIEILPQTGTGSPCPEAVDCSVGEGECSQDSGQDSGQDSVDCHGVWSACTNACETAEQREWIETIPQIGTGSPCPEAVDCSVGDGDCVHKTQDIILNIVKDITNCSPEGWGECVEDETALGNVKCSRQWDFNYPCLEKDRPVAPPCSPGEGSCPRDCEGYWSQCTSACETGDRRVWTTTVSPIGGRVCPPAEDCKHQEGYCRLDQQDALDQMRGCHLQMGSHSCDLPCLVEADECKAPSECVGREAICSGCLTGGAPPEEWSWNDKEGVAEPGLANRKYKVTRWNRGSGKRCEDIFRGRPTNLLEGLPWNSPLPPGKHSSYPASCLAGEGDCPSGGRTDGIICPSSNAVNTCVSPSILGDCSWECDCDGDDPSRWGAVQKGDCQSPVNPLGVHQCREWCRAKNTSSPVPCTIYNNYGSLRWESRVSSQVLLKEEQVCDYNTCFPILELSSDSKITPWSKELESLNGGTTCSQVLNNHYNSLFDVSTNMPNMNIPEVKVLVDDCIRLGQCNIQNDDNLCDNFGKWSSCNSNCQREWEQDPHWSSYCPTKTPIQCTEYDEKGRSIEGVRGIVPVSCQQDGQCVSYMELNGCNASCERDVIVVNDNGNPETCKKYWEREPGQARAKNCPTNLPGDQCIVDCTGSWSGECTLNKNGRNWCREKFNRSTDEITGEPIKPTPSGRSCLKAASETGGGCGTEACTVVGEDIWRDCVGETCSPGERPQCISKNVVSSFNQCLFGGGWETDIYADSEVISDPSSIKDLYDLNKIFKNEPSSSDENDAQMASSDLNPNMPTGVSSWNILSSTTSNGSSVRDLSLEPYCNVLSRPLISKNPQGGNIFFPCENEVSDEDEERNKSICIDNDGLFEGPIPYKGACSAHSPPKCEGWNCVPWVDFRRQFEGAVLGNAFKIGLDATQTTEWARGNYLLHGSLSDGEDYGGWWINNDKFFITDDSESLDAAPGVWGVSPREQDQCKSIQGKDPCRPCNEWCKDSTWDIWKKAGADIKYAPKSHRDEILGVGDPFYEGVGGEGDIYKIKNNESIIDKHKLTNRWGINSDGGHPSQDVLAPPRKLPHHPTLSPVDRWHPKISGKDWENTLWSCNVFTLAALHETALDEAKSISKECCLAFIESLPTSESALRADLLREVEDLRTAGRGRADPLDQLKFHAEAVDAGTEEINLKETEGDFIDLIVQKRSLGGGGGFAPSDPIKECETAPRERPCDPSMFECGECQRALRALKTHIERFAPNVPEFTDNDNLIQKCQAELGCNYKDWSCRWGPDKQVDNAECISLHNNNICSSAFNAPIPQPVDDVALSVAINRLVNKSEWGDNVDESSTDLEVSGWSHPGLLNDPDFAKPDGKSKYEKFTPRYWGENSLIPTDTIPDKGDILKKIQCQMASYEVDGETYPCLYTPKGLHISDLEDALSSVGIDDKSGHGLYSLGTRGIAEWKCSPPYPHPDKDKESDNAVRANMKWIDIDNKISALDSPSCSPVNTTSILEDAACNGRNDQCKKDIISIINTGELPEETTLSMQSDASSLPNEDIEKMKSCLKENWYQFNSKYTDWKINKLNEYMNQMVEDNGDLTTRSELIQYVKDNFINGTDPPSAEIAHFHNSTKIEDCIKENMFYLKAKNRIQGPTDADWSASAETYHMPTIDSEVDGNNITWCRRDDDENSPSTGETGTNSTFNVWGYAHDIMSNASNGNECKEHVAQMKDYDVNWKFDKPPRDFNKLGMRYKGRSMNLDELLEHFNIFANPSIATTQEQKSNYNIINKMKEDTLLNIRDEFREWVEGSNDPSRTIPSHVPCEYHLNCNSAGKHMLSHKNNGCFHINNTSSEADDVARVGDEIVERTCEDDSGCPTRYVCVDSKNAGHTNVKEKDEKKCIKRWCQREGRPAGFTQMVDYLIRNEKTNYIRERAVLQELRGDPERYNWSFRSSCGREVCPKGDLSDHWAVDIDSTLPNEINERCNLSSSRDKIGATLSLQTNFTDFFEGSDGGALRDRTEGVGLPGKEHVDYYIDKWENIFKDAFKEEVLEHLNSGLDPSEDQYDKDDIDIQGIRRGSIKIDFTIPVKKNINSYGDLVPKFEDKTISLDKYAAVSRWSDPRVNIESHHPPTTRTREPPGWLDSDIVAVEGTLEHYNHKGIYDSRPPVSEINVCDINHERQGLFECCGDCLVNNPLSIHNPNRLTEEFSQIKKPWRIRRSINQDAKKINSNVICEEMECGIGGSDNGVDACYERGDLILDPSKFWTLRPAIVSSLKGDVNGMTIVIKEKGIMGNRPIPMIDHQNYSPFISLKGPVSNGQYSEPRWGVSKEGDPPVGGYPPEILLIRNLCKGLTDKSMRNHLNGYYRLFRRHDRLGEIIPSFISADSNVDKVELIQSLIDNGIDTTTISRDLEPIWDWANQMVEKDGMGPLPNNLYQCDSDNCPYVMEPKQGKKKFPVYESVDRIIWKNGKQVKRHKFLIYVEEVSGEYFWKIVQIDHWNTHWEFLQNWKRRKTIVNDYTQTIKCINIPYDSDNGIPTQLDSDGDKDIDLNEFRDFFSGINKETLKTAILQEPDFPKIWKIRDGIESDFDVTTPTILPYFNDLVKEMYDYFDARGGWRDFLAGIPTNMGPGSHIGPNYPEKIINTFTENEQIIYPCNEHGTDGSQNACGLHEPEMVLGGALDNKFCKDGPFGCDTGMTTDYSSTPGNPHPPDRPYKAKNLPSDAIDIHEYNWMIKNNFEWEPPTNKLDYLYRHNKGSDRIQELEEYIPNSSVPYYDAIVGGGREGETEAVIDEAKVLSTAPFSESYRTLKGDFEKPDWQLSDIPPGDGRFIDEDSYRLNSPWERGCEAWIVTGDENAPYLKLNMYCDGNPESPCGISRYNAKLDHEITGLELTSSGIVPMPKDVPQWREDCGNWQPGWEDRDIRKDRVDTSRNTSGETHFSEKNKANYATWINHDKSCYDDGSICSMLESGDGEKPLALEFWPQCELDTKKGYDQMAHHYQGPVWSASHSFWKPESWNQKTNLGRLPGVDGEIVDPDNEILKKQQVYWWEPNHLEKIPKPLETKRAIQHREDVMDGTIKDSCRDASSAEAILPDCQDLSSAPPGQGTDSTTFRGPPLTAQGGYADYPMHPFRNAYSTTGKGQWSEIREGFSDGSDDTLIEPFGQGPHVDGDIWYWGKTIHPKDARCTGSMEDWGWPCTNADPDQDLRDRCENVHAAHARIGQVTTPESCNDIDSERCTFVEDAVVAERSRCRWKANNPSRGDRREKGSIDHIYGPGYDELDNMIIRAGIQGGVQVPEPVRHPDSFDFKGRHTKSASYVYLHPDSQVKKGWKNKDIRRCPASRDIESIRTYHEPQSTSRPTYTKWDFEVPDYEYKCKKENVNQYCSQTALEFCSKPSDPPPPGLKSATDCDADKKISAGWEDGVEKFKCCRKICGKLAYPYGVANKPGFPSKGRRPASDSDCRWVWNASGASDLTQAELSANGNTGERGACPKVDGVEVCEYPDGRQLTPYEAKVGKSAYPGCGETTCEKVVTALCTEDTGDGECILTHRGSEFQRMEREDLVQDCNLYEQDYPLFGFNNNCDGSLYYQSWRDQGVENRDPLCYDFHGCTRNDGFVKNAGKLTPSPHKVQGRTAENPKIGLDWLWDCQKEGGSIPAGEEPPKVPCGTGEKEVTPINAAIIGTWRNRATTTLTNHLIPTDIENVKDIPCMKGSPFNSPWTVNVADNCDFDASRPIGSQLECYCGTSNVPDGSMTMMKIDKTLSTCSERALHNNSNTRNANICKGIQDGISATGAVQDWNTLEPERQKYLCESEEQNGESICIYSNSWRECTQNEIDNNSAGECVPHPHPLSGCVRNENEKLWTDEEKTKPNPKAFKRQRCAANVGDRVRAIKEGACFVEYPTKVDNSGVCIASPGPGATHDNEYCHNVVCNTDTPCNESDRRSVTEWKEQCNRERGCMFQENIKMYTKNENGEPLDKPIKMTITQIKEKIKDAWDATPRESIYNASPRGKFYSDKTLYREPGSDGAEDSQGGFFLWPDGKVRPDGPALGPFGQRHLGKGTNTISLRSETAKEMVNWSKTSPRPTDSDVAGTPRVPVTYGPAGGEQKTHLVDHGFMTWEEISNAQNPLPGTSRATTSDRTTSSDGHVRGPEDLSIPWFNPGTERTTERINQINRGEVGHMEWHKLDPEVLEDEKVLKDAVKGPTSHDLPNYGLPMQDKHPSSFQGVAGDTWCTTRSVDDGLLDWDFQGTRVRELNRRGLMFRTGSLCVDGPTYNRPVGSEGTRTGSSAPLSEVYKHYYVYPDYDEKYGESSNTSILLEDDHNIYSMATNIECNSNKSRVGETNAPDKCASNPSSGHTPGHSYGKWFPDQVPDFCGAQSVSDLPNWYGGTEDDDNPIGDIPTAYLKKSNFMTEHIKRYGQYWLDGADGRSLNPFTNSELKGQLGIAAESTAFDMAKHIFRNPQKGKDLDNGAGIECCGAPHINLEKGIGEGHRIKKDGFMRARVITDDTEWSRGSILMIINNTGKNRWAGTEITGGRTPAPPVWFDYYSSKTGLPNIEVIEEGGGIRYDAEELNKWQTDQCKRPCWELMNPTYRTSDDEYTNNDVAREVKKRKEAWAWLHPEGNEKAWQDSEPFKYYHDRVINNWKLPVDHETRECTNIKKPMQKYARSDEMITTISADNHPLLERVDDRWGDDTTNGRKVWEKMLSEKAGMSSSVIPVPPPTGTYMPDTIFMKKNKGVGGTNEEDISDYNRMYRELVPEWATYNNRDLCDVTNKHIPINAKNKDLSDLPGFSQSMNGWCVVGSPAPSQEEDEEALCLESVGQTLTTTLVPSKAYIPPLNKEMCFIDVDKAGCTTLSDEGAKWYTGFVDLGDDIEVRGINAKEKLEWMAAYIDWVRPNELLDPNLLSGIGKDDLQKIAGLDEGDADLLLESGFGGSLGVLEKISYETLSKIANLINKNTNTGDGLEWYDRQPPNIEALLSSDGRYSATIAPPKFEKWGSIGNECSSGCNADDFTDQGLWKKGTENARWVLTTSRTPHPGGSMRVEDICRSSDPANPASLCSKDPTKDELCDNTKTWLGGDDGKSQPSFSDLRNRAEYWDLGYTGNWDPHAGHFPLDYSTDAAHGNDKGVGEAYIPRDKEAIRGVQPNEGCSPWVKPGRTIKRIQDTKNSTTNYKDIPWMEPVCGGHPYTKQTHEFWAREGGIHGKHIPYNDVSRSAFFHGPGGKVNILDDGLLSEDTEWLQSGLFDGGGVAGDIWHPFDKAVNATVGVDFGDTNPGRWKGTGTHNPYYAQDPHWGVYNNQRSCFLNMTRESRDYTNNQNERPDSEFECQAYPQRIDCADMYSQNMDPKEQTEVVKESDHRIEGFTDSEGLYGTGDLIEPFGYLSGGSVYAGENEISEPYTISNPPHEQAVGCTHVGGVTSWQCARSSPFNYSKTLIPSGDYEGRASEGDFGVTSQRLENIRKSVELKKQGRSSDPEGLSLDSLKNSYCPGICERPIGRGGGSGIPDWLDYQLDHGRNSNPAAARAQNREGIPAGSWDPAPESLDGGPLDRGGQLRARTGVDLDAKSYTESLSQGSKSNIGPKGWPDIWPAAHYARRLHSKCEFGGRQEWGGGSGECNLMGSPFNDVDLVPKGEGWEFKNRVCGGTRDCIGINDQPLTEELDMFGENRILRPNPAWHGDGGGVLEPGLGRGITFDIGQKRENRAALCSIISDELYNEGTAPGLERRRNVPWADGEGPGCYERGPPDRESGELYYFDNISGETPDRTRLLEEQNNEDEDMCQTRLNCVYPPNQKWLTSKKRQTYNYNRSCPFDQKVLLPPPNYWDKGWGQTEFHFNHSEGCPHLDRDPYKYTKIEGINNRYECEQTGEEEGLDYIWKDLWTENALIDTGENTWRFRENGDAGKSNHVRVEEYNTDHRYSSHSCAGKGSGCSKSSNVKRGQYTKFDTKGDLTDEHLVAARQAGTTTSVSREDILTCDNLRGKWGTPDWQRTDKKTAADGPEQRQERERLEREGPLPPPGYVLRGENLLCVGQGTGSEGITPAQFPPSQSQHGAAWRHAEDGELGFLSNTESKYHKRYLDAALKKSHRVNDWNNEVPESDGSKDAPRHYNWVWDPLDRCICRPWEIPQKVVQEMPACGSPCKQSGATYSDRDPRRGTLREASDNIVDQYTSLKEIALTTGSFTEPVLKGQLICPDWSEEPCDGDGINCKYRSPHNYWNTWDAEEGEYNHSRCKHGEPISQKIGGGWPEGTFDDPRTGKEHPIEPKIMIGGQPKALQTGPEWYGKVQFINCIKDKANNDRIYQYEGDGKHPWKGSFPEEDTTTNDCSNPGECRVSTSPIDPSLTIESNVGRYAETYRQVGWTDSVAKIFKDEYNRKMAVLAREGHPHQRYNPRVSKIKEQTYQEHIINSQSNSEIFQILIIDKGNENIPMKNIEDMAARLAAAADEATRKAIEEDVLDGLDNEIRLELQDTTGVGGTNVIMDKTIDDQVFKDYLKKDPILTEKYIKQVVSDIRNNVAGLAMLDTIARFYELWWYNKLRIDLLQLKDGIIDGSRIPEVDSLDDHILQDKARTYAMKGAAKSLIRVGTLKKIRSDGTFTCSDWIVGNKTPPHLTSEWSKNNGRVRFDTPDNEYASNKWTCHDSDSTTLMEPNSSCNKCNESAWDIYYSTPSPLPDPCPDENGDVPMFEYKIYKCARLSSTSADGITEAGDTQVCQWDRPRIENEGSCIARDLEITGDDYRIPGCDPRTPLEDDCYKEWKHGRNVTTWSPNSGGIYIEYGTTTTDENGLDKFVPNIEDAKCIETTRTGIAEVLSLDNRDEENGLGCIEFIPNRNIETHIREYDTRKWPLRIRGTRGKEGVWETIREEIIIPELTNGTFTRYVPNVGYQTIKATGPTGSKMYVQTMRLISDPDITDCLYCNHPTDGGEKCITSWAPDALNECQALNSCRIDVPPHIVEEEDVDNYRGLNPFSNSNILSNDMQDKLVRDNMDIISGSIYGSLEENEGWTKCFSRSIDDDALDSDPQEWRNSCPPDSPGTLIVGKNSEGHIFGGYTGTSWGQHETYSLNDEFDKKCYGCFDNSSCSEGINEQTPPLVACPPGRDGASVDPNVECSPAGYLNEWQGNCDSCTQCFRDCKIPLPQHEQIIKGNYPNYNLRNDDGNLKCWKDIIVDAEQNNDATLLNDIRIFKRDCENICDQRFPHCRERETKRYCFPTNIINSKVTKDSHQFIFGFGKETSTDSPVPMYFRANDKGVENIFQNNDASVWPVFGDGQGLSFGGERKNKYEWILENNTSDLPGLPEPEGHLCKFTTGYDGIPCEENNIRCTSHSECNIDQYCSKNYNEIGVNNEDIYRCRGCNQLVTDILSTAPPKVTDVSPYVPPDEISPYIRCARQDCWVVGMDGEGKMDKCENGWIHSEAERQTDSTYLPLSQVVPFGKNAYCGKSSHENDIVDNNNFQFSAINNMQATTTPEINNICNDGDRNLITSNGIHIPQNDPQVTDIEIWTKCRSDNHNKDFGMNDVYNGYMYNDRPCLGADFN